jgi:sugar lactone lactonase YvrE
VNYRSMIAVLAAGMILAGCDEGAQSAAILSLNSMNRAPSQAPQMSRGAKQTYDVYVASLQGKGGRVTVYSRKTARLIQTISNNLKEPSALIFDFMGNLFVSAKHGIYEFGPGQDVPSRILHGVGNGDPMAIDGANNLYVGSGASVHVYAPGATSPSRSITDGVTFAAELIFDRSGNLYVANGVNSPYSISVYAPGGSTPFETITQGIDEPTALAVDTAGNLYVADSSDGGPRSITVYAPTTGALIRTITGLGFSISPQSIALDTNDNLFVVGEGSTGSAGSVDVIKAGKTRIGRSISSGIDGPIALAFDQYGRLYVANAFNNTVTAYVGGGEKLGNTYSDGINLPEAIAFSP